MRMNLISLRIKYGLTCSEMAARLGISKSFYEKLERNERDPSYRTLKRFKKAFQDALIDSVFFAIQNHRTG